MEFRHKRLQDVRVREALVVAFDFEWRIEFSNMALEKGRQLFRQLIIRR